METVSARMEPRGKRRTRADGARWFLHALAPCRIERSAALSDQETAAAYDALDAMLAEVAAGAFPTFG